MLERSLRAAGHVFHVSADLHLCSLALRFADLHVVALAFRFADLHRAELDFRFGDMQGRSGIDAALTNVQRGINLSFAQVKISVQM
jgi:hypothetical protein